MTSRDVIFIVHFKLFCTQYSDLSFLFCFCEKLCYNLDINKVECFQFSKDCGFVLKNRFVKSKFEKEKLTIIQGREYGIF